METNPYQSPEGKMRPARKSLSAARLIGIALSFALGLFVGYYLAFVVLPAVKP